MGTTQKKVDFSDMSGGMNTAFPPHAILKNQVQNSLNVIHERIGLSRACGYVGISFVEPPQNKQATASAPLKWQVVIGAEDRKQIEGYRR